MQDMLVTTVDLDKENVAGVLNLLLLNVPEDSSLLEKIRWLYIKSGQLFSYDYRIAQDIGYGKREIDFYNNHINRYLTCTQISYLFKLMVEFLDPNIKAKVVERVGQTRRFDELEHVAVEVELPNGEKYLFDLTLDLYLIQSGCMTKHFGFETDANGSYDIIALSQCQKMDEKLGLIKNGEYTDKVISKTKVELSEKTYETSEKKMDACVSAISNLVGKFHGAHEGKQYINKLLTEVAEVPYKEFNLSYENNSENQLVTCFVLYPNGIQGGIESWLIYNSEIGLLKSSKKNILAMLNTGWTTRSNTLTKMFEENETPKFGAV